LKPSKKIRVWLASNFILLRSGLRALLTGRPTLKCIGESELGGDALERIEEAHPDVLILDVDAHDRRTNVVLK
jgi:DNA-binding NarL/FixJ family response regulator